VGTDGARTAVAAANLRIDSFTAEVVTELRVAGVRILLLKGPGVARLLYDGAGERAYVDADLLVAPRDLRPAERTLRRMGFQAAEWLAWLRRARPWTRPDGTVDLHTSLFGITMPAAMAWEVLSRATETIEVGGMEMAVLAPPARVLHVATHVAQHPTSHGHWQARADLERAVTRVPLPTWQAAARLAAELGAEPALAGDFVRSRAARSSQKRWAYLRQTPPRLRSSRRVPHLCPSSSPRSPPRTPSDCD
jgi:hypothetical protein